jgi:hypothetical protein
MQSPEILLHDLNNALRDLYGATQLLSDERLKAELPLLMRRLLLAEVLGNTSILAIGGSQGAGKTTLLRSLYATANEEFKWLDPNEGRGEKLPVLILEDSSHKCVQGAVRRLKQVGDRYELVTEEVDVAAFQKAISDPDLDVLLPVLKVPQRYFSRSNQAWLLLPGYEPQKRENKTWQELMRQALVGATGCVVVTDETRMANQEQVKIVNDMLSNELRGAQALVVISKTEGARGKAERLKELRATAGKVFGVPPESTDRWVICTGADDSGYIDEWLPRMKAAVDDLSRSGGGDRKAQLSRLEGVLNRDLTMVLGLISNKTRLLFQEREGGEDGPREVVESCLQAYGDAVGELREEYQEEVARLLDKHFAAGWETLQERLKEDHEGMWNGVKGFFKTATESQQFIETDVGGAWGSSTALLEKYADVLGKMTFPKLGAPQALKPEADRRLGGAVPLQRLGYVGDNKQAIAWQRPDDEDKQNLRFLLAGNRHPSSEPAPRATAELERSVKLLPVLALEYARVGSIMPGMVGVKPDSLVAVPMAERPDIMRETVKQMGEGIEIGKTLLHGIATVLTVDVVSDGDVDVIPAFLNVFKGAAPVEVAAGGTAATSTGAAAGAGTGAGAAIGGIGAAVVGVVAVGYLTYSAMRATRIHDEKARVMAHSMLMSIKDHHQHHFMHHFNHLMAQVRVRLRQSLRERYRLNESLMEKDRLAVSIGNVRSLQRDLLDHIGRSGQSIALFDVEEAA